MPEQLKRARTVASSNPVQKDKPVMLPILDDQIRYLLKIEGITAESKLAMIAEACDLCEAPIAHVAMLRDKIAPLCKQLGKRPEDLIPLLISKLIDMLIVDTAPSIEVRDWAKKQPRRIVTIPEAYILYLDHLENLGAPRMYPMRSFVEHLKKANRTKALSPTSPCVLGPRFKT
jgi:hypothetical protein